MSLLNLLPKTNLKYQKNYAYDKLKEQAEILKEVFTQIKSNPNMDGQGDAIQQTYANRLLTAQYVIKNNKINLIATHFENTLEFTLSLNFLSRVRISNFTSDFDDDDAERVLTTLINNLLFNEYRTEKEKLLDDIYFY